MMEIPLRNRKGETVAVTLVDDCDFEEHGKYLWYRDKGYAVRNVKRGDGSKRLLSLHRAIMRPPPGMEIDHIDGDGLNNRRANLRVCTRAENAMNNSGHLNRKTSSKFIGVGWSKEHKVWRAELRHKGKQIHIGYFPTEEQAARARDAKALELRGEYAKLNYPITQTELQL